MPDRRKSTLPSSYVRAEARAVSLTIRALAAYLDALAAHVPLLAVDLRGALEVASRDHLRAAADGLDTLVVER